jgi:hypothetical protein
MSIFGAADVHIVSSHNGPVVMQLLADGVPLELLLDIALAEGDIALAEGPRDGSPPDPENRGYYWL